MELSEAIRGRRTIRKWTDRPVPESTIHALIDHAQWAPSACNLQAWNFIVITDATLKKTIKERTGIQALIQHAPLAIFVCYDKNLTVENYANIQSAAAAIQNMLLYAHSIGLGGAWIATLGDKEVLRAVLHLPTSQEIVAVVLFGYPEESSRPPKRKDVSELIHWNYFERNDAFPSSDDPDDWTVEQVSAYRGRQIRAKSEYYPSYLSEFNLTLDCLRAGVSDIPADTSWLDLFPCTGVYLNEIYRSYGDTHSIDFCEQTQEVAEFIRDKNKLPAGYFIWGKGPDAGKKYGFMTCIFRLESYPRKFQQDILKKAFSYLRDDGRLIIFFYSSTSYYAILRKIRRWVGHAGLKYALWVAPNIGPFKAINPRVLEGAVLSAGFTIARREYRVLTPSSEEIRSRIKNAKEIGRLKTFYPVLKLAGHALLYVLALVNVFTPILKPFSKIQMWELTKERGRSPK